MTATEPWTLRQQMQDALRPTVNQIFNKVNSDTMKQVNTTVNTGDKITIPGTQQTGEIGTIKNGLIKILWYSSPYSGFSEHITTRELNRRIKENRIQVLKTLKDN